MPQNQKPDGEQDQSIGIILDDISCVIEDYSLCLAITHGAGHKDAGRMFEELYISHAGLIKVAVQLDVDTTELRDRLTTKQSQDLTLRELCAVMRQIALEIDPDDPPTDFELSAGPVM